MQNIDRTMLKSSSLSSSSQKSAPPANHQSDLIRLRKISGQIEGIERMISERRYCPDILVQIKAATSALKAVELSVLERHVRHCIADAAKSGNKREIDKKIEEVIMILARKA